MPQTLIQIPEGYGSFNEYLPVRLCLHQSL